MLVTCIVCGILFEKPMHRIKRMKYKDSHYCSRSCYKKQPICTQVKTGYEIECIYCGKRFYRSAAQIERSKSGERFCSKTCMGKYRTKTDPTNTCLCCGKTFYTSPGRRNQIYYCSRSCWKKYTRSNGRVYYKQFKLSYCEICGFIPEHECQLDVHHLDKDRRNNSLDNLKTICANCHRLLHKRANNLGVKNEL